MKIIEQSTIPKNPKKKNEDGIVVTPDFVAVIDGSTSKSTIRYNRWRSNGRYCMQIVDKCLRKSPKDITATQFCREVTRQVRKQYSRSRIPLLTSHPEERMAASAVVFSRVRREIWMIGDCQCLVNGELLENPKPYEQRLAELRSEKIKQLMAQGITTESLRRKDPARNAIIPLMLQEMQGQNRDYSVIDGFDIPMSKVVVLPLSFDPFEIVLASDGYPFLRPTLTESEEALEQQLRKDPLNIGIFKATKGWMEGNTSFDDRTYIRFNV